MAHPNWTLRRPDPHDADGLARVHNECWREAYGTLLPADFYDDSALDAVVGSEPCQLWVARDNRRAQAFYRRNGFVPDGAEKQEDRAGDLWVMRLVR
ncbi:hypothetical protein M3E18_12115 [Kocuria sp. p3-SID1433]|uniref:hypothetical protein n=1 Tax=unclassified Kocuria TaxID=2649579 RepID=UPI0021A92E48|nr:MULTISPECIES: hypothetical protein [unclassified Kocuria]MCT1603050.1 hypothetical protein [Kocuria sp. p3-SID1428]MCT2181259.1 hypothetical protein [Kocuria sp. p3-SID1433]